MATGKSGGLLESMPARLNSFGRSAAPVFWPVTSFDGLGDEWKERLGYGMDVGRVIRNSICIASKEIQLESKTETITKIVVNGDENHNPITGHHSSHPVGVGTGAAGGGVAGAVLGGTVGGPIGAGIGAVVGAVTGAMAGKSAAEAINPTAEHEFWRVEFKNRPYFTAGTPYEQYGPAYQYGWASYANNKGKTFVELEEQLARDWENRRGKSKLSWVHSRDAAHDAWMRAEKAGCEAPCISP